MIEGLLLLALGVSSMYCTRARRGTIHYVTRKRQKLKSKSLSIMRLTLIEGFFFTFVEQLRISQSGGFWEALWKFFSSPSSRGPDHETNLDWGVFLHFRWTALYFQTGMEVERFFSISVVQIKIWGCSTKTERNPSIKLSLITGAFSFLLLMIHRAFWVCS